MRTEDVLAAVGYGVWQWDESTGTVAVDGRAARLLGLSGGAATHRSSEVRARLHPADYVTLVSAISLAGAEGTVAESLVRVVGPDGTVHRTVRIRLRPRGRTLSGTMHEVRGRQHAAPDPARDWRRSREAFLLDAGRALAEADSTAEVLRVAAGLSMPGFSPDGLAVFGREGDHLTVVGHYGQKMPDTFPREMPLTTGYPATEVIRTGQAVYLPTPRSYEEHYPTTWPLVRIFGRSSWGFLPLTVAGATIGVWMAAFREPVEFTPEERSVLTTVARMMAQALARAGLHESERALSEGLQQTMMPADEPAIDGMSVAARYVPTGGGLQVGGDWYDLIDLPSGRTAIVIGDVQGHDVRAAGLMGQLKIALRAYAAEGHRPDAVLSRTSRFLDGLAEQTEAADVRFATCLYLEIDQAGATLDVVRAGHPEPCVRLGDGTTIVRRTDGGPPLGIDPEADYPTTRLTLEPGEVLLLCTDGLIETGGHDLETGWDRLRGVLEAGPADDLEALADALVQAVHGPPSHHTTGPLPDRREDDIALVLLRREPDGPCCAVPVRRTVLTVPQADPALIRGARDDVRALLHDWDSQDQLETAVLLVSEVVTNVLVHTDEDATLIAQVSGLPGTRRLRVEVGDRSDDMPHLRSPGELASSGRGLLLMAELADRWGVDPRGEGKSIWFELHED
ncbi:Histidine kinase-like ATPase domain-containing protein [Streptomyces sp. DvalAA-14]|uniref:SpoIIE family protein phosphatase n=1 Tax=unclassified Streptomyces TaxID=2593676 RepID=UPI00081B602F|nr:MULTISPECIES: SpoIIE family protein phosphatase [unclassified Streptomyces]MYS20357.1 SpoIIE family protein phosphatase [Streptomyces sp. SID4948]SCD67107.1 Histidine kinase-like ATPase domain-containing protein [Streptomyces sp. DvalAA-14]